MSRICGFLAVPLTPVALQLSSSLLQGFPIAASCLTVGLCICCHQLLGEGSPVTTTELGSRLAVYIPYIVSIGIAEYTLLNTEWPPPHEAQTLQVSRCRLFLFLFLLSPFALEGLLLHPLSPTDSCCTAGSPEKHLQIFFHIDTVVGGG